MSFNVLSSRAWRLPLVAGCLALMTGEGTFAQGPPMLASTLSTHTSGAQLRAPEADGSPDSTAAASAESASEASLPTGALTVDSSSADGTTTPGPIPTTPLPAPAPAAPSPNGTELAVNSSKSPAGAIPEAPDPAAAAPSQNATINLINLMVKRKLISQEDADGLIRQSQQEADLARAQAVETQAKADRALAAQQVEPAPAPPPPPTSTDDETRVTYVPDVVKKQITDQVTENVMEQTREEHLADTIAASQVPEWVRRFHVVGDVRIRFEDDTVPSDNAVGNFTNFNAINTGGGFNVNTTTPQLPQYDVDQNRNRLRLRARIGAGIDLGDNFTAGMRIATGSDDNPVTENQTLGQANNAQGGDFAKYQIWLDRAFIRYEYAEQPEKEDLTFTIGRFDNPFFNTSMVWANDLGFDGAVVKVRYEVLPGVSPFLTFGGFPVFNTDLNFSTYQSEKFQSEDKYLLAIQGGTRWQISKDIGFIGAVGYYDFENIEGQVSQPIVNSAVNAGNTDDSRPSFAQNGNTYIALRDYEDPFPFTGTAPNLTPIAQNQFYGLATPFNVLSVTGQLDYSHFDPFHMSITGVFIKNLAFDRNNIINGGPTSNRGRRTTRHRWTRAPLTAEIPAISFTPMSARWCSRSFGIGTSGPAIATWKPMLTPDAFTDSDFGGVLTGTNLKGYTIEGQLGLGERVWAGLRWLSSDNVSGPTFKTDVLQLDLNARF